MRDSKIKEPSVIYVITQPFFCFIICTTHDLTSKLRTFIVLLYPGKNKKKRMFRMYVITSI